MIGFVVGAAALTGLFVWKRHRHHHCHGHAHGHHGHHHHRRHRGWRARWIEHRLMSELDCTPSQERLIREEVRALIEHMRGLKEERAATREDVARAVAGAQLDRGALLAMFARHDQRLVELRAAITASLERVHATLDGEQRERLAAMVRGGLGGPHAGPSSGPFR